MAKIALVAAVAHNGAIGVQGRLPWRLPGDLAFFKRTTMGKPLVIGRKTWESLPNRPLPGRPNLVVTRTESYITDGAEVFASLETALDRAQALAADAGVDEVAVIGGAEIYRQALPRADQIYLTEVDMNPEADAFFPTFNRAEWHEVWRESGPPPKDPSVLAPAYSFVLLRRRSLVMESG